MNKTIMNGRLTRDPEFTHIGETPLTKFDIAVNDRPYVNKSGEKVTPVVFMPCELWGNGAEWFSNNMKKGERVLVEGKLKQDTWEDKNTGAKRSKLILVTNQFEKLDWNNVEAGEGGGEERPQTKATAAKKAPKGKTTRMKPQDDGDIPSFDNEDGEDIPF